jgi:hypothetical protein
MTSDTAAYEGILRSDGTIQLDTIPPAPPGRVEVTLRLLPGALTPPSSAPILDTLAQIRQAQQARGYQPPPRGQIEAELAALDADWDERDRRLGLGIPPPASRRSEAVSSYIDSYLSDSDLSRLECTIHAVRHPHTGLLYDYRRFFSASAMRTAPLTAAVYERAADLRAAHGHLRTPDALHLACALEYGCSDFLTHDQNLQGFPGINVIVVL